MENILCLLYCCKLICGCLCTAALLCAHFSVFIYTSWPLAVCMFLLTDTHLAVCFHPQSKWPLFLAYSHQLSASLKVTTSSATLPQILAKWKNKKNINLTTCYCACLLVVTTATSQSLTGGAWLAFTACLLSAPCVYSEWNSKWSICLHAVLCAPLTTLTVRVKGNLTSGSA